MQSLSTPPTQESNNDVDIKELVIGYLIYWKWYLLCSVLFFMGVSIYIRYAVPLYGATTIVLIKDEKKGGGSSEMAAFSDLDIFSGYRSNITNEIALLKSRTLSERIVKTLGIDFSYFVEGKVINLELYKNNPIQLDFVAPVADFDKMDTTFIFRPKNQKTFVLLDSRKEKARTFEYGDTITTSLGRLVVNKTSATTFKKDIVIVKSPLISKANQYRSKVKIVVEEKSNILELSIVDNVQEKSIDFLNTLVAEYNNDAIEDRNLIANNTSRFINNRLLIISTDLSGVESTAESFKKKNKVTSLEANASLQLENAATYEKSVIETEMEIKLTESVIDEVANITTNQLIPNDLLTVAGNSSAITTYNELVLNKRQLLKTATIQNPAIVKIEDQLLALRGSIAVNLKNALESLKLKKRSLANQENKYNAKVSEVPTQERQFRIIDRQQKIIESLYLYLLQKREETQISLAVTFPKAKVIDTAFNSGRVSTDNKVLYGGALLLGLLLPTLVIFLIDYLDTKIKTHNDVEGKTSIPFLGEVPKSLFNEEVIKANSRSSSAEAIRIVRTNLDFILANVPENQCKTIFVTSSLPKEGKTFISINLATTIALSSKKVLIIGLDIRNPKLENYVKLPSKGLTNYLSKNNENIHDYIVKMDDYENFHALPSGVIPPNPVELLMNNKINILFEQLKKEYDYIIVDTAPVSMVTDTLLIAKNADAFIYVMRANYLEKRMLKFAENLYKEKKLPNMSILLNDTNMKNTYGYGYGYGYQYGNEEQKKTWKDRLFKKKTNS